jgi:hypothetical protein
VLPAPSPYVIGFAFIAPLAASEVFGFHVAGAAFTWPANFAGAFVHAVGAARRGAGPRAQGRRGQCRQLHHRPDGTITASNQGAIPVAKGALITLEGPAAPDANAAKTGLTLIGTRT